MTTVARYVIDTSGVIRAFPDFFEVDERLSAATRKIIDDALMPYSHTRLSIPSIVFVEIFEKWLKTEEKARAFYYSVFQPFVESPNVEIKPLEREVLDNLFLIRGSLAGHDLHDKLVLASAMMLKAALITTDHKIQKYVEESHVIPQTLS